jgi:hypothetical protein
MNFFVGDSMKNLIEKLARMQLNFLEISALFLVVFILKIFTQ